MAKATGYVVYKGPSMLDGAPIVGIVTMKTSNPKTGPMAQLWIMRSDIEPHHATKNGTDSSVCGNCPQRHYNGGACYVTPFQAPLSIWRSYHKGNYEVGLPVFDMSASIRLGAYGDPSALPYDVIEMLAAQFGKHTGYTHQIARKGFDQRFLELLQVSAETPKQALKAQSMGASTFRIKYVDDGLLPNEIECLADTKGITCEQCALCNGSSANVAISVHGSKASKFKSQLIEIKEVA